MHGMVLTLGNYSAKRAKESVYERHGSFFLIN
jgi:hypothetical protein